MNTAVVGMHVHTKQVLFKNSTIPQCRKPIKIVKGLKVSVPAKILWDFLEIPSVQKRLACDKVFFISKRVQLELARIILCLHVVFTLNFHEKLATLQYLFFTIRTSLCRGGPRLSVCCARVSFDIMFQLSKSNSPRKKRIA